MRKLLASIIMTLALLGCGSQPAPEAPVEQVSQAQAIDALRQSSPFYDGVPDSKVIELFDSICGALDRGASYDELVMVAIDLGAPAEDAGRMVVASTMSTCPEYTGKMNDWLEE